MRVRTPLTGAEMELEERARLQEARLRGRDPERLPDWGPLKLDGALPVGHPLEDTQEDRRRLRRRMKGHRQ